MKKRILRNLERYAYVADYIGKAVVFLWKHPEVLEVFKDMPFAEALGCIVYIMILLYLWDDFISRKFPIFAALIKKNEIMTKAEIAQAVSAKTGIEKKDALNIIEAFMLAVKENMENGEEVFLRGFGSFIIKHRAEKTARNISKNVTMIVPAHDIPAFKPAQEFLDMLRE